VIMRGCVHSIGGDVRSGSDFMGQPEPQILGQTRSRSVLALAAISRTHQTPPALSRASIMRVQALS
jgi:hypothetical protein